MKVLNILIVSCILLISVKCGPTNWVDRKNTRVQLFAEILKNPTHINLGDTLKVLVTIPDSLEIKQGDNIYKVFVESVEDVGLHYLELMQIDTVNKRLTSLTETRNLYEKISVYGKAKQGGSAFKTSQKPFHCLVLIIPKVRGLFYLQTRSFDSNIKVNKTIEGITDVSIKASNNNVDLITPYAPEISTAVDKTYAFQVK